jgi:uncharacterized protein
MMKPQSSASRPVRAGLFTEHPPRLLGTRCSECSCVSFPARDFCAACRAERVEAAVLSGQGAVYSYTVVHQAPQGRAVPYVLAYVDLDEGARLLARVEAAPDAVGIGTRVCLQIGVVGNDDGVALVGYHFALQEAV